MKELKEQISMLTQELNELIVRENYEMQAFSILERSKELDELVVRYQRQLFYK